MTKAALQWARRKGVLHQLRVGIFTSTRDWEAATPAIRHQLSVLAHQRTHPEWVASATSAAVLLDLPTPAGPPAQPQFTVARVTSGQGGRGNRSGALARRSWLAAEEIWIMRNGIRVTSPVRTVLDCAREWDAAWGLALADAMIARWQVVGVDLVASAEAKPRGPGQQRMRWVVEQVRARVESPLESLARAAIVLAELPEPVPQVQLWTRLGAFRVDLLDKVNRLITEADGKLKYTSPQALWEEKRREDALRESGFEVVRFTMADHHNPTPWIEGYRRALGRAQHRLGR
jgi:very-short-patch-repair endonuclease